MRTYLRQKATRRNKTLSAKQKTANYAEQLEEYPDEYLDCRVDRHSWRRPKVVDPYMAVPYGWPVYRECAKCGAFWSRSYNRMMTAKVYERRVYPQGYLIKGAGHNTMQRNLAFVREVIEREGTIYIAGDGER